ncbi:hypothetical protein [Acetobacter nitrogenifigens]|nr:hypothetical protein [Acetobacter nitrogenifigens]
MVRSEVKQEQRWTTGEGRKTLAENYAKRLNGMQPLSGPGKNSMTANSGSDFYQSAMMAEVKGARTS